MLRLLGYGGLIPFVGLSAFALYTEAPDLQSLAREGLALYTVAILSFVGAVSWGIAVASPGLTDSQRRHLLIFSVIPSLLVWLLWFLPDNALRWFAFAALTIGIFFVDRMNGRSLGWPSAWLQLRLHLSVVVAGVLMIATQGQIKRLLKPEAMIGVRWGLLVGLLIAAYTLVDAYGVKVLAIAPVLFDWSTTVSRTLMMLPHMARQPKRSWQTMRGYWPVAWAVGALSPLGYILVLYALRDGAPVSLVAPAREMSMLLVTLAGLYILREPVGWGRLVGCCLIALGVVMLVGG
jgi:uncharacterized membrane protein